MIRRISAVLFLMATFSALFTSTVHAQSRFVHASGKELVDAADRKLLLRGINLGNWMVPEGYMFRFEGGPQSPREIEALVNEMLGPTEAASFWHQYRDQYITQRDIASLREQGFNSIRIPLHYKFFQANTSDGAGNAEGFALLDRVVGWAHDAGLYVILDMHCAPGGQTGTNIDDSWGYPWLFEDQGDQQQTIAVWKLIAAHYRDNPTVIGYDLLNEPIPHYPSLAKYNDRLEPIYKQIARTVRAADPNHIIILGGAQWDSNFKVFGAPFDSNVMYTFHKYWSPPTQAGLQEYVAFRDRYNVPIWLGESGENSDVWIREFVHQLEADNIGWAFWPYKKMEKTSSVTTFAKPIYWDEVVEYAKHRNSVGEMEKTIALRPSLEHSRAAFQDLLLKIRFENCKVNKGYLEALGLPQK